MAASPRAFRNNLAIWYALALTVASLSWMVWYDPHVPRSMPAYLSCTLGIVAVFGAYLLLDCRLVNGWLRFALAGFAAMFAAYVLVDAALLNVTAVRLHHAFSILNTGGDLLVTLGQAGFRPKRLAQIGGVLTTGFIIGGLLHRYLPRWREPGKRGFRAALTALLVACGLFVGEQAWSREVPIYHIRDMVYPGCWQVFSGGPNGFTERIPPPMSVEQRRECLRRVEPPSDSPNVVFVLLESVREDMVHDGTMPNLAALAGESLDFKNAYAAAGFTHLSWNTILLDRPAFTFWLDHARPPENMAAWPLEVFHAAGYDIQLSISTVFDYKGFGRRVRGDGHTIDRYFQGNHFAPNADTDPLNLPEWDTAKADREAADHAVEWIGQQPAGRPFFMLINLNATHWPYQFDESQAIARPYQDMTQSVSYTTRHGLDLMFARYRNAANQVDRNLGRVITALKAAGIYDRTAIVVTSDHGEAFEPGFVGHSSMLDCVRRVPLVMKLPGVAARQVESFVSHQDIYPTLLDHAGVRGIDMSTFMGRSVLRSGQADDAVLTIAGSVKAADLTTDRYVIRYTIKHTLEQITFMPIMVTDRRGNPCVDSVEQFRRVVDEARPALRQFVRAQTDKPGQPRDPALAAR